MAGNLGLFLCRRHYGWGLGLFLCRRHYGWRLGNFLVVSWKGFGVKGGMGVWLLLAYRQHLFHGRVDVVVGLGVGFFLGRVGV
eukprot:scaffold369705_cov35-Attheya_sp.AAC.1